MNVQIEVSNEEKYQLPPTKISDSHLEWQDQFIPFEDTINNRVDSIDRKVCEVSSQLSEKLGILTAAVEEIKATQDHSRHMMTKIPKLHKSYIEEIRNISLPGVHKAIFESVPKMHVMVSLLIHLGALLISAFYIQDAYQNWQNALIVQSLTYTRPKDIPFPALTICEPLGLKDDYNRFEILQRCVSIENSIAWLCSEDELNLLRISTDITPIEYDLLPMNESDRDSFTRLYYPIFDDSIKTLPVDLHQTFSASEYLKYIEKLGKQHLSQFKIYNPDFIDGHYHTNTINSSSSQRILMTRGGHIQDRIRICQTFNAIRHGPQEIKTKKVSDDLENHHGKNTLCNPENALEKGCNLDLLYTDNFLEIEFDDAGLNELSSVSTNEDEENSHITLISKSKRETEKYIVIIHYNFNYPSFTTMTHDLISRGTTLSRTLNPSIINARKDLFEVDTVKRNCVFSHEKKLSLFTFYTYNNCIFECQMNCSLSECGCVPYHLAIFNGSFNICSNHVSRSCLQKSGFFHWHLYKDKRCKCDCPTDCVSIELNPNFGHEDTSGQQTTTYQVSYSRNVISSVIRYKLTGPAEFVAYSLGILGVFNGFSMDLVWQMAYWLTLGLWCTVRNILHDPL